MTHRSRIWLRAAVCAGAVLTSSACFAPTSSPRATPSHSSAADCRRSAVLVPRCGLLWGVTTETPTLDSLRRLESGVGRRFDMVYRFHSITDAVPTADERRVVAGGRVLHLALDSGGVASRSAPGRAWSDVAGGRYDDALRRTAHGVASLGAPVFVTFDHEANNPAKLVLGDPADFVAAWRHVHDLFAAEGTTNAVWVWVVMGAAETVATLGDYWPGNRVVDWLSWDVYNQSGCLANGIDPARYESFEAAALPVYRWIQTQGPGTGVDPTKPMMISEAGSVVYPDDPALTAQWYSAIPKALAAYPEIKAVGLWDHTGNGLCDYRFQDDVDVLKAVRSAGEDPRVAAIHR